MTETDLQHAPETLEILDLGRAAYTGVLEKQRNLQRALIAGTGADTLVLCEHEQVITLGRRGDSANILRSAEELEQLGIEIVAIERGGDVTWHGPGQLVAYPIIDLARKRKDVGWYMRSLEDCALQTLLTFGIQGERIQGKTGVWIRRADGARKIASIGVRISRWCTLHGISLNIDDCSAGFALIHPCGLKDTAVTLIAEELGLRWKKHTFKQVQDEFTYQFKRTFGYLDGEPACLNLAG